MSRLVNVVRWALQGGAEGGARVLALPLVGAGCRGWSTGEAASAAAIAARDVMEKRVYGDEVEVHLCVRDEAVAEEVARVFERVMDDDGTAVTPKLNDD